MNSIDRILRHQAALPLGTRCLLRFRGPDRLRYLNGQLTNDLRSIPADHTLHACVTDAKGRLLAEVRVFDHDDALWVEAPAELRDDLPGRLDRYLVADEVEWSDESDRWHLVHLIGKTPGVGGDDLDGAPVSMTGTLPPPPTIIRQSKRLGIPGLDLWLPADDPASVGDLLAQFGTLAPDHAESIRIAHGIPAWGAELTPGMLPPEAGLESSAISYTKGCYIGQEVLSRLHSIGRVNRHLVRLQLDPATDPASLIGAELHDPQRDAPAGHITSVSPLILEGDQHRNALAFRSRQSENASRFEVSKFRTGSSGKTETARLCQPADQATRSESHSRAPADRTAG